jgi:hypothetical protein
MWFLPRCGSRHLLELAEGGDGFRGKICESSGNSCRQFITSALWLKVRQMVRTAVLICCPLGESTYPPNRQMTIAIAKIDIAVMAVGTR